ncbi:VOC family protein [Duganella callida]|uniref:VOC family protein n=1 Tax=Duganella callida TaxID=2561932 RepID=A0A4Y9SA43_9BURK|nr:VOC family protein [Duganella callida]
MALEVISVAVSDIDRSLEFYTKNVGFGLDVDYRPTPSFRVVQLTPPGSACSIHLIKSGDAGRIRNLTLVTTDLVTERDRLLKSGVNVEKIRHKTPLATWAGEWADGVDPERHDYASFANFLDPDGNEWTLQERGFQSIY